MRLCNFSLLTRQIAINTWYHYWTGRYSTPGYVSIIQYLVWDQQHLCLQCKYFLSFVQITINHADLHSCCMSPTAVYVCMVDCNFCTNWLRTHTVHMCIIRRFMSAIWLYTVLHVLPTCEIVPFDFYSVVVCSYYLTLPFHSPNFWWIIFRLDSTSWKNQFKELDGKANWEVSPVFEKQEN